MHTQTRWIVALISLVIGLIGLSPLTALAQPHPLTAGPPAAQTAAGRGPLTTPAQVRAAIDADAQQVARLVQDDTLPDDVKVQQMNALSADFAQLVTQLQSMS